MIQVKNLTKYYGPTLAVDNISFHVEAGEIVGFLGPNGAGKSTTLRILTGFQPATSGSAAVAGFDVFTQSMEVRRNIGYLPETCPLYPEMRVREYLHFRAKLRGMDRSGREASIERVAKRCWISDFIDRPCGQLSKGMRQRVGLAEALVHDPKVLVLDEPSIGLDPTQIRETRNLIMGLAKNHTIMFSSHILPEVEAVCQRTIIIAGGRIVASGSPSELRDRMAASSRLIAEIRGPQKDIESTLSGLEGVKKIESVLENGWCRLAIETAGKKDVREDLYRAVSRRDWTLREMRRETGSLEEFFIQITARQAERAG